MIKENSSFTPLESSFYLFSSRQKSVNFVRGSKRTAESKVSPFLTGFTLTEVIISITILVLIIVSIFSLYLFNQRAFQEGEASSEVLQNGRVILERITREIRQTDEIVTSLPDVPDNPGNPPPEEILFHDGHLPLILELGVAQGASQNTIILTSSASSQDDYYKGVFLKIISGTGSGQIKKIIEYNGTSKTATIKGNWETTPDTTSNYKIDTSYYYIYYFKDDINVKREALTYYFSGDSDTYVPWNAEPPTGQTLEQQLLEEEIIGEYVSSLKFWQSPVVNIALSLQKGDRILNLQTKVFGRNL